MTRSTEAGPGRTGWLAPRSGGGSPQGRALAVGILAGLLCTVAPRAQDPPEDGAAQPPRFRTEANFVRVDAYPTRDGRPVLDLGAEDFELLENGVPQDIQTFEHVVITPAGPQNTRTEASSVAAAEQMASNPRNRVFVFFLDSHHVGFEGAHRIRQPLIDLMDRILGPDDLVAVMTPWMSARQITFGRKTQVISDLLNDRWQWGLRGRITPHDEHEQQYEACYPSKDQQPLVAEMKARRRERAVLDALHDLAHYLGGVREERKAILTVTEGWLLFRPNDSLMTRRGREPLPGTEPVGVDPQGRLRVGGGRNRSGDDVSQTVCDRERMYLSSLDNDQHFRDLLDVANRNNASFYPIDPRGLAVFDSALGPEAPPDIRTDMARARLRTERLRTLAENTDGVAVVDTNDLRAGVRRIADDLTSYYLLGYYSSNRLDGGYRRLTVRVKRPGVEVRARRGYRAATAEELSAARSAAAAPVPEHVRTTTAAFATLARIRPDQRFSINAVPVREGTDGAVTAVWIAGELLGTTQERSVGGTVAIELTGGAPATAAAELKPGEHTFIVRVPVDPTKEAVDVRARFTGGESADVPFADAARIDPESRGPLLFRRGPSTGNRVLPAGDFRFSRTERLRLDLPIPTDAATGAGRFMDRNAQPLQVPLRISERTEDGQRWLVGEATLAPLAAGDYALEVTYTAGGTEHKVVTAIRVTR